MKRTLLVSAALFFAVFLIPILSVGQALLGSSPPEEIFEEADQDPVLEHGEADETGEIMPENLPSAADEEEAPPISPIVDDMVVTMLIGGEYRVMALRDFIIGGVTAEMPALYPKEALKAQAVAIRTLAKYSIEVTPRHENAVLCDDYNCCLSFRTLTERSAEWGDRAEEFSERITSAVQETENIIMTYNGTPIFAAFFAATEGRTRTSEEVWGGEPRPYLQSVASVYAEVFPGERLGHGVGMSQFGARQMALDGNNFREILEWYYTGVEVG